MKKTKFFLGAAMAAVLCLWTGCREEQSEMTLDVIEGRATIQGRVMYDQGARQEEDAILDGANMAPASGITITVKIPYGDYKSGSDGKKLFTATTDANGNYSITFPVTSKGVEATIDALPFYASHGTLNNDGTVTTSDNVLFNVLDFIDGDKFSVEPGDIEVANIEIKPTTTEDQPKRNQSINIKGKVVYMGEVRKETAGVETYVQDEIVSANSQIKITLSGTDPDKKQPDIIYNLTTDGNGEYSLTALFYEVWEYSDVEVTAKVEASYAAADSEKAFKHYFQEAGSSTWLNQKLSGVYSEQKSPVQAASSNNKFIALKIATIQQEFTPEDYSIIRGIGNPDVDEDEDGIPLYKKNNPMGWTY